MYKLLKILVITLLSTLVLIISFYLSTFVQTWWDTLDPGAQYVQPTVPDDMKEKTLRAIRYHGPLYNYKCDFGKGEFTFKRDGQVINMFAYLENRK